VDRRAGERVRVAPYRAVDGTDRDAVEARVDPFVLRRVDWFVGLDPWVLLAVAVGVEDERCPSLRLLLVAVSSQTRVLIQPATPNSPDQSVLFASCAKLRWNVPKQVFNVLNDFVFGS
jgi:hypothetical protein